MKKLWIRALAALRRTFGDLRWTAELTTRQTSPESADPEAERCSRVA